MRAPAARHRLADVGAPRRAEHRSHCALTSTPCPCAARLRPRLRLAHHRSPPRLRHDVHVACFGALCAFRVRPGADPHRLQAVAHLPGAEESSPVGARHHHRGASTAWIPCSPVGFNPQPRRRAPAAPRPADRCVDRVTVSLARPRRPRLPPSFQEDTRLRLAKVVTNVPTTLSRRLDPRAEGRPWCWRPLGAGHTSDVIHRLSGAQAPLRMLDAPGLADSGPLLRCVHESCALRRPGRVERVRNKRGRHDGGIEAFRFASLARTVHRCRLAVARGQTSP